MILDEIVARRRQRIAEQALAVPEAKVRRQAPEVTRIPLDFAGALRQPGMAVIAEVKRRSPSAGEIRPGLNPASLARTYAEAGAAAVSVLAEPDYFGGGIADVAAARESLSGALERPLLFKDFVVSDYQVYQARLASADAVLLIAACLSDAELERLKALVEGMGMAALVEVHDERDAERALRSQAAIVGINNRDLRSFRIDLGTTTRLAPTIVGHAVLVSESGIRDAADVRRLAACGVDAVLVGQAIAGDADPAAMLRRLVEAGV